MDNVHVAENLLLPFSVLSISCLKKCLILVVRYRIGTSDRSNPDSNGCVAVSVFAADVIQFFLGSGYRPTGELSDGEDTFPCFSSPLCKSILLLWHRHPPCCFLRLSHSYHNNCHQDVSPLIVVTVYSSRFDIPFFLPVLLLPPLFSPIHTLIFMLLSLLFN